MSLAELARLEWNRAPMGDSQPCGFCGHGAIMRHPITHRPCHKVCSDERRRALIDKATRQAAKGRL